MTMTAMITDILKKPYGRVIMPEPDGTFRAEIIEFPGCIAIGDTAQEALENLESVAEIWLQAALEKHQAVPEPIEATNFSGKLVVRMPKTLHKKAAHLAAREGVSLNQFILSSLAEYVGNIITSYNMPKYYSTMSSPYNFSIINNTTESPVKLLPPPLGYEVFTSGAWTSEGTSSGVCLPSLSYLSVTHSKDYKNA